MSKYVKQRTSKEKLWEHGNITQFCKSTRTPPLPRRLSLVPAFHEVEWPFTMPGHDSRSAAPEKPVRF